MINLKNVFDYKTLFILPHLDDEFAVAPLIVAIKKKSKASPKIIFCAERIDEINGKSKMRRRRSENFKSIKYLGLEKNDVYYLNDYFKVSDLKLYEKKREIFEFLKKFVNDQEVNQVITTNFEGGHPDHDALAIIVNKISHIKKINPLFIPAYNSRPTAVVIPFSVARPLKSQLGNFTNFKLHYLCWIDSMIISMFYITEFLAIIKIIPFLVFNTLFSNKIFVTNKIDIDKVDWNNSLSFKRYKIKREKIVNII
jgi:LmbE family N-acetylglucosaminyl deacetylase